VTSYNLFTTTPAIVADVDTNATNAGTEFYTTATGWVTQVRYLHPSSGGGSNVRTMGIYSTTNGTTGTLVAGPFTMPAPAAGTWVTYTLPTPLQLVAGTRYRVVTLHPVGAYAATGGYFASGAGSADLVQGILVRPNAANALSGGQGSYFYAGSLSFPTNTFNGGAYYSDVTVTDVNPSAGSAFSGSVALAGAGSLAGSGKPAVAGGTAPSGAGSLALGGSPAASGTATTGGTGTLALSGVANASGSLTLGGTGSLAFSAGTGYTGSLTLSGTGGLVLAGTPKPAGTLSLNGSGSLALSGNGSGAGTGSLNLTGSGTLTLTGAVTATGALTLGGMGQLTATGQPATGAALSRSGMGVLTLSGVPLGLPVDITATGTLGPRRWAVTLSARSRTGSLDTKRWAGSL
jgi:hypothetical protein